MKLFATAALSLTLTLTLSSTPALAGELHRELIPADARWVAHVDVEGLQQTVLFKTLLADHGQELDFDLGQVEEFLGADPLALVGSATFFGTSDDHEKAVALLWMKSGVDQVLERLQALDEYSPARVGDFEVHSWSDGDDMRVFCHAMGVEGSNDRVLVLSDGKEKLLHEILVLHGAEPNLTSLREPALKAQPRKGSFLYVEAAHGIPGLEHVDQASMVAGLAKSLKVDVGETGGELSIEVEVRTAEPKDAQNISAILQGAIAMAQMALSAEEELFELEDLLTALEVRTAGATVKLGFRYGSRQLIDLVKTLDRF